MIVTNPFDVRKQIDKIGKRWWLLAVTGILSVVAGAIILGIDWTRSDLAIFVGALFFAHGFLTLFTAPADGSNTGFAMAAGLIEIGLAVVIWSWPSPSLLVIAYAIGWYVLFSGIFTIAGAVSGRDVLPFWGYMLAFGILEVVLSFWLLADPELTLTAAVVAVGLWSIFYGVMQIILAFELHRIGAKAAHIDRGLRDLSSDDLTHAAS